MVNDALRSLKQVVPLECTTGVAAASMFNGRCRNGGLVLTETGCGGPLGKGVESFSLHEESARRDGDKDHLAWNVEGKNQMTSGGSSDKKFQNLALFLTYPKDLASKRCHWSFPQTN